MTTAGRVNRFAWLPRPGYEDAEAAQENAGDLILGSVTTSNGGVVRYELLPKDAGVSEGIRQALKLLSKA